MLVMENTDSNKPQIECDIAVIGAGVAGMGAAYFLSQDANVVVLEQEDQPAYHSSGRSAALYIEGYENPVVAGLTAASGDFFRQPPAALTASPLLHDRGGLTVARPGEAAQLDKYLNKWSPFCARMVRVEADECLGLCPALRPDQVLAGAYDPSYMGIDTHELMQCYQRGLKANGGRLLTRNAVTAIARQGNDWLLTTPQQQVRSKWIVNAAGAWANQIGLLAGLPKLALQPLRRTAVLVSAPDHVAAWPIVHTLAANLYFKPESPGLMISPQDETPSEPMDAYPEDLDIAIALDTFAKLVDFPVKHVQHGWAGLRTFAPDRYPVVGADPAAENFFWLAGQGGFGVQTSPGLGAITADAILKGIAVDADIHRARLG